MDSAEQAALSSQPESSQGFQYYNARRLNVFGLDGRPADGTREMTLTPNPHFDHLPVNTTLSSVLMPPTVTDSGKKSCKPTVRIKSSRTYLLSYRFRCYGFNSVVRTSRSIICK